MDCDHFPRAASETASQTPANTSRAPDCTAKLTAVTDDDPRTRLYLELLREYAPVGATENILVAEMARRAVNIEWWSAAARAVCETATRTLADLVVPDAASDGNSGTALAAAASCNAVARAERTSLSQGKAFLRALQRLLDLQARRKSIGNKTMSPPSLFSSEEACSEYLLRWRLRGFRCAKCATRRAHFIPSRHCIECVSCGSQSGLRVGTVMAESPLPYSTWFAAIFYVLGRVNIRTVELQSHLGLSRYHTAQSMADKIRDALTADDRTTLLAGLDSFSTQPESSVHLDANCPAESANSQSAAASTEIIHHQQLTPCAPG